MKFTSAVLSGVVGAGAVAGALAFAGAADAAPGKCTAAEFARTHSTVSSQVASYLDKNPTINDGITNAAKGAPEGQRHEAIKTYLDGQPAAKAELDKIRQPLTSLKNSCGADTDDAAPAAPAGLVGQAPAEQPATENAPAEQPQQQPWNPFAPQQQAQENTETANTQQAAPAKPAAPNVTAVVDQQDV
ncbi:hemophore-related protein [Mycobacteroides franklinii]|uniref:hemophore-related protein n=1 Tax=Mycobacteroides franklinii TaxID=948102 RepID=UPI000991A208|nr:hemophore-related protein [Mycobacteroides franklinii]